MTEIELDTPSLSEELGGAAVLPLGEAPPHPLLPGEGGVGGVMREGEEESKWRGAVTRLSLRSVTASCSLGRIIRGS